MKGSEAIGLGKCQRYHSFSFSVKLSGQVTNFYYSNRLVLSLSSFVSNQEEKNSIPFMQPQGLRRKARTRTSLIKTGCFLLLLSKCSRYVLAAREQLAGKHKKGARRFAIATEEAREHEADYLEAETKS